MLKQVLTAKQKALEINLNPNIYGTLAEIGAGQETVRAFFRAGGASKTVAKAISAYDKDFSDAIYGKEPDMRYVCESRIRKMLHHETQLIEERLNRADHLQKTFFVYANTVATIDYKKLRKGHGWVGIHFQLTPEEPYNEIILHLNFHQNEAQLQQETLGELGTNLIYGAFHYSDNPRKLLFSLYDNISKDKIDVDTINFSGPRFRYIDNRMISLQLVKQGMTDTVIFGPDGKNILPADLLFKKHIFVIRGSFRPVTKLNMDMLHCGYSLFLKEPNIKKDNIIVLYEITLSNLTSSGDLDEQDFLDRTDILGKLNQTVMISRFSEYYRMVDYFSQFTNKRIGLVIGVNNLLEIFEEKYYHQLSGGILEAFGRLFTKDLNIYLYPFRDAEESELLTSDNLKVGPQLKELYKYFKINGRIIDIKSYNPELLRIYSREVLRRIATEENSWEEDLPEGVAKIIKENRLFGYDSGVY
ncbi:MAG: TonB-dependent receptor [Flavobacteriales bacterium AspAUS03]